MNGTNSAGSTKQPDIEEIRRFMATIPEPGTEGVPIAFLLTYPDLLTIQKASGQPTYAWLGIPLCLVQGLRVSVALMPDGTTHPIPRKKT